MEISNRISPTIIQVIEEPTQFGPIVVNTMICELDMACNIYRLFYTYKLIDGTEEKVVHEMLFDEDTNGVCYNTTFYPHYVLDDARNTCADLLKNVTDNDVIEKTIKQVFEDKLELAYKEFILTKCNKCELFKKVYKKLSLVKHLTYSVSNCKWKYHCNDVLQVSFTYKAEDENNGSLLLRIVTSPEDYPCYKHICVNTLCKYTLKKWIKNEDKINLILQKFNDFLSNNMKTLHFLELFRKIPSIISEKKFNEENVNDDYIRNIVSKINLEYSLL